MSSPESEERSVTRTFRAALRIGEDYITLEETIKLPLEASDEEIEQAVDLGWRIYTMQREAMESQIASVREAHNMATPIEFPASDRQRNYISVLQSDLNWSEDQLLQYAHEHGFDFDTLSRNQASAFIDNLKKVAEERVVYQTSGYQTAQKDEASEPSPFVPLTDRQYRALVKLAAVHKLNLDEETQQRFGLAATEISSRQAGDLISEWQR